MKVTEHVYMIRHAVDAHGLPLHVLDDPSQEFVQPGLPVGGDGGVAILGAENDVIE